MYTMATIDAASDAQDLLASIHLEKYLNHFRQAGFLLARDFCHVDNAALNRLGVTATGHRKRILKLVEHIQLICQHHRKDTVLDRCNSESAIHEVTPVGHPPQENADTSFKAMYNSSAPNLSALVKRSKSECSATVIKPVPKPRTVFNKQKMKQSSIAAEDSPCSGSSAELPSPALSIQKQSLSEEKLNKSISSPDISGPLPPVPPRITCGAAPFIVRGMSSQAQQNTLSLASFPDSPSSYQCSPFTSVPGSPPSPPCSDLEMVSNEIYSGTLPATPRSISSRSTPMPPPRQEISTSTDSNRIMFIKGPAEEQEEISPYCETVFHGKWQNQHHEVERSPKSGDRTGAKDDKPGDNHRHQSQSSLKRQSHGSPSDSPGYSTVGDPSTALRSFSLPPHSFYPSELDEDQFISPYASFTSLSERPVIILSGWLDKLSPQGNYVFQKRYVKFDGKNLMYYGSEKDPYPKGVIPLGAIQMARAAKDNKFEVVTNHRTFVFRADNEVQRSKWCSVLQEWVKDQLVFGRPRFGPGSHCQRNGFLELKGIKSKIYAAIITEQIWLYKNEQCFKNGIGITVIEARGATIRDGKNKSFDLITPYKNFSFSAESEREKREWMEALQESIAETLSDYEVAEKIWSNRSNRVCADCKAINPDWASINLCVVICKNCAGQHRGLGTMVSKVQSLKLDTSVWSNEIVQLFIMLGNDRANEFWAARLPAADEMDCDASPEQRREFITQKYKEGRFRHPHGSFSTQEELLKTLCTAVTEQNLLKTVTQIFAEAEAARLSDSNGHEKHLSLHYSYNQATDSSVYDEIMQPVLYSGYLYKSSSINKGTLSRRTREDFQKYWCSVEKSLLFYESDRCHEPNMKIEVKDIICLGVSRPDLCSNNNGFIDRFRYTFELYLTSDKLIQFGLETPDALHNWAKAIGKATTPLSCHCLLTREFERVGMLRYKAMLDPRQWKEGFFVLQKSNLFICPGNDGAAEDIINLKRLQELSIASETGNHEKKDILVLVEKGRTLHLQGIGRTDFSLWYADIQKAAGGKANTLKDQQLSRNDIPIIVDSCIAFITQYGLGHEGIYRKNGAKSRIKLLMEEFRKDARNVKLRIGDNFIEDVTDVLKRFFREIDDPIFMADLHPYWKEAAKISNKTQRLDRYKELIRGLPRVNRTTLSALISHLYRVQKCADLNQMCTKNLSLLFAPSLFQTDGKGEHEVKIVEDLIDNYLYVFDIDEEHKTQIELEISLITTWKDTQLSQAGDLIIEVYLEEKTPDCCITLKVSPTMCAEELTNQVLYMRNVPAGEKDVWMTFEAIEDGELERPLHPKEKVLEQALQWCTMADPSSAYLLVKKVPRAEVVDIFTAYKSEIVKFGVLKCREETPKLLQGTKFQEHLFQILDHKLLLIKDKKNNDLRPPVMRRHSSSDICKQKFGTMPLVPIRGEESNTNSTMLSANQTLPMKVQQDSLEERSESPEPLYEEVGDFGLQVLKSLENSFLSSGQSRSLEVPPRSESLNLGKSRSLECTVVPKLSRSRGKEGSLDMLMHGEPCASLERKSCSPSEELLLHELSTIFKKPEDDEQ
ncbi:Arf-GAP with Rho-GAP domain, ANK repeat and PH domain-containing protein 3 [Bagarius yarrelli]|uniref:Arf-GAP with Rho-GAP domain, ANK repeat and PH domain-containing protein 3 n=1 Tax=Bagarius yarrelli TaxID=175774 RepID=A0A556TNP2_BAGYA|nr:Arf-GAP with Rho-GAP domain, ANK repeat and PH domain-containing protein 3 [Bagarius yarrelli]